MDNNNIGERFSSRVRQLRLSKKMTQEQLAERADIDASVISRIERGLRTNIRLDTLAKIGNALNVDYATLLLFPDNVQTEKRIESKLALISDEDTLKTIEKLVDLLIAKK